VQSKAYPADKFTGLLPVMAKAMAEGKMTLPQVVAQCQKTGQLTPEQLAQLEAAAPVEVNHEDDDEVF
jgi:hypothetical protein